MSHFEAVYENGAIVMTPVVQTSPLSRIVFYDMTEDTFEWKRETSEDGTAWTATFQIKGRRIR